LHNCLVMHTDLLFDFEHLPYEINFFNFHQDSKILLDGIDYHLFNGWSREVIIFSMILWKMFFVCVVYGSMF